MTRLLLVRHGETDWNAEGRWQGHSNTPLNVEGRRQARALAGTLGPVDAVYSSDLARARETAEILADPIGVRVILDPRLRERGFGEWEGLTSVEIEARFPEPFRRWRAREGAGADGAEPFAVFAARVQAFVEDARRNHAGETVLVVAHGGTIRVLHALAAGLDYVRDHATIPPVANCAVAEFAVQDGKLTRID